MDNTDLVDDGFRDALNRQDDIGLVILAHIHIEAAIDDFNKEFMADAEEYDAIELEFSKKASLASALGLHQESLPVLRAIGKMRNRFAHRLDQRINDDLANNLYSALSGGDKSVVQETYKHTLKTNPRGKDDEPLPQKFNALDPRDRLILLLVTVRAKMLAARMEAAAFMRNGEKVPD